jgi:HK97 family phage major capsid protein
LADSALLANFLQTRMIYGLKIEEERQILVGNSANGELGGLCDAAAAYTRGATNQSLIDCLANAKVQLELNEYTPDGVILNPIDFLAIETSKDSQNRYLFGDPRSATPPSIWDMNVVMSNSMTAEKFLVGMFSQAAMLWDREEAACEFSSPHSDFFQRNLIAVRCEERVALTVLRSAALCYGNTAVQT